MLKKSLAPERLSIFDMLKIGVGPSSSHTYGPWKAILLWLETFSVEKTHQIKIHLYGSLAKTGAGHGTDIAIIMGLLGEQPETTNIALIGQKFQQVVSASSIELKQVKTIPFVYSRDLIFHFDQQLPFHSNGMLFEAYDHEGRLLSSEKYYSIGGGFVAQENTSTTKEEKEVQLPFPCNSSSDLIRHCKDNNFSIFDMVWANEQTWKDAETIHKDLIEIWSVMKNCLYKGCHTNGILPGGLEVKRRAADLNSQLSGGMKFSNPNDWIKYIRNAPASFSKILKWISCFAFAVNEENASLSRVVTAPTNGAAGVIPTVIMYYLCFSEKRFETEVKEHEEQAVIQFLCIAAELGTFFKKGATISAAMGGCQAEIGVSSAMAAGALTECLGGSVEQSLMAAEIAMEHHLGLTCDPIGGLVQIPCIERNSMGAIKAITAANIALESNPKNAKVSLDNVINTLWETAKDMNQKYKETSEGGLAINIPVNVVEC